MKGDMEDDIERLSTTVFGLPDQPHLGLVSRVGELEKITKEMSKCVTEQRIYNKIMVLVGSALFMQAVAELWKIIIK